MQHHKPSIARPLGITSRAPWLGFLRAGFAGAQILCLALVFSAGACAASEAEIRRANASGYQSDFATVYGEALAATVELYPHTVENAVTGLIQTAWHPVVSQAGSRQNNNPQGSQFANTQNTGGIGQISGTADSDAKRFYIRFRVHVVGGKPWRVRVVGEASEWRAGDVPMPLRGAEVPPWVKGRTDALRVEIHRRLKKFAVVIDKEIPIIKSPVLISDEPAGFGEIPGDAEEVVGRVYRAIRSRDMSALRADMADDLQWSFGDAGSADVALALWQADTKSLDELSRVLRAGCASGDGAVTVSCPKEYSTEANFRGYRAIFEKRGKAWVLTAFLSDY